MNEFVIPFHYILIPGNSNTGQIYTITGKNINIPINCVGASHGNLPHVKNFGNQVTLCWQLNNIA
jgi:hypothetical protein